MRGGGPLYAGEDKFEYYIWSHGTYFYHLISLPRPKYQSILTSLLQDPKKVLQIPLTNTSSLVFWEVN